MLREVGEYAICILNKVLQALKLVEIRKASLRKIYGKPVNDMFETIQKYGTLIVEKFEKK